MFDLVVVGAGAAGLMTAIATKRDSKKPHRVLMVDSRRKFGAKILISGGTRCNVTHQRVSENDYFGGPKHFVRHVLAAFNEAQTVSFFESIGVELVLEPTGKLFPKTHSSRTVLEALTRAASQAGVEWGLGQKVIAIRKDKDDFLLRLIDSDTSEEKEIRCKRVALATGGLSMPETGSDGTGYEIAKSFGHGICRTEPALTPLESRDEKWQALTGLSTEVNLTFYENQKKKVDFQGPLLITHFGFSGPTALNISRFVAYAHPGTYRVEASFIPTTNKENFIQEFLRKSKGVGAHLKKWLAREYQLPERLVEHLLTLAGIRHDASPGHLSAEEKEKLRQIFLCCSLPVSGVLGYRKAEVTAGGVNLEEVEASSMRSKLCEGLYFVGEILDVDGRIGGFNFQWAWSSGVVAARHILKSLENA